MTFAHVGTTQSWDTGASHSYTPNGVGHLVTLVEITKLGQTPMISGLSASNITWTRLTPDFDTSVAATATAAAIWVGKTTSTSPANTTITWTGGGSEPAHWEAEVNEFSSTVGDWALDVYGGIDANGGNLAYPSLTPAGAGELYVGMHYDDSGAAAGSTSGYTYHVTSHGNGALYNPACGSGTQTPTWAGTSVMGGIAALIKEQAASDSGTAAVTLKKMSVSGSGCASALYGAYAFDEGAGSTIIDHSGNGHDMTIVGSNSWVTGHGSYVKAFQSGATASDGAYYDHGSADSVLASDVVVMMWYKHTGSTSTSICHVGGIYSASATARLAVYSYRSRSGIASSPHVTSRDSAGTISDVGVNSTTADGSWHHAAVVYHANGLIEEYLDGSLVASSTPTANPIGSNSRYIGVGDFLSGLATTEAQVQDLRVFSGALNADKIVAFMNTPVQNVTSGTAAVTLKKMTVSANDGLYTVWHDTLPDGGTSSTPTGQRNDGLVFTVTQSCQLKGIAFYVPSGETTLTGSSYTAALYTTTTGTSGTLVTSQAGSGTFTAGKWNWIPLDVSLSTGVTYVAVINSPNNIQFEHNWWNSGGPGTSGFTDGPISVPGQSSAPGTIQQGFLSGALAFPSSANNPGTWYGVDVKVSTNTSTSDSGTAAVTLKKMTVAGTATAPLVGTAAVTLKKMSVSGTNIPPGGWDLVSLGPVSSTLSPSFGQPTTAHNFLVAWVGSNDGLATDPFSSSSPGWVKYKVSGGAFDWTSIWYKKDCSDSETAPVFSDGGGSVARSMLGEFSGGDLTSPADQSGSGTGDIVQTASCAAPDAQGGDLIISAIFWNSPGGAATASVTMTDSNGASVTPNTTTGQTGGAGTVVHAFSWGIAGSSTGASDDTAVGTLSAFAGGSSTIASFKAASGSSSVNGTGAVTLKKMTAAVSGNIIDSGTAAGALKKMTVAGTATAPVGVTAAVDLKKMTVFGLGKAKISGTIDISLRKMTDTGVGFAPIFGTVDITLPKMKVSASDGHVVQASSLFIFMQP